MKLTNPQRGVFNAVNEVVKVYYDNYLNEDINIRYPYMSRMGGENATISIYTTNKEFSKYFLNSIYQSSEKYRYSYTICVAESMNLFIKVFKKKKKEKS